jgi:hypothetical protein
LWITQLQNQPQNESYNKLIYIMSIIVHTISILSNMPSSAIKRNDLLNLIEPISDSSLPHAAMQYLPDKFLQPYRLAMRHTQLPKVTDMK